MLNYQRVLRLFTLQSSPRAEVRGKDAMDSLEEHDDQLTVLNELVRSCREIQRHEYSQNSFDIIFQELQIQDDPKKILHISSTSFPCVEVGSVRSCQDF